MKYFITFFCLTILPLSIYSNKSDSLMHVLEASLVKHQTDIADKENKLSDLKSSLNKSLTKEEQYHKAKQIIGGYSYFISDSTLYYSKKCLDLAIELNNDEYLLDTKLQRAHFLSFPQLFHEAFMILDSIDPDKLSLSDKAKYYRVYISVYFNQMRDLDDPYYRVEYQKQSRKYAVLYLSVGNPDSVEYLGVLAFRYFMDGMLEEAVRTINVALKHPDITPYMHADLLFRQGGMLIETDKKYWDEAKLYLIQASIEYNKLAITRDPPLMYLARILLEEKDTERAYNYINIAMSDVEKFSNNHRNSVANRTYALIQHTHNAQILSQQNTMQRYVILLIIMLVVLIVICYVIFHQMRLIKKKKAELSDANENLQEAVKNLQETNHVKETYIGHYLNQYSTYVGKLKEYRKYILRRLNAGQIEELIDSETNAAKNRNETDLLFSDFDNAFLELYPYFIENVNALLSEDNHYALRNHKEDKELRMNTELRILALFKLGISDNKEIASFFRITKQAVYNCKSKIKAKAINGETFEDDIKKISN